VVEVSFVVFLLVVNAFSFAYFFPFFWKPQNPENKNYRGAKMKSKTKKKNYLHTGEHLEHNGSVTTEREICS